MNTESVLTRAQIQEVKTESSSKVVYSPSLDARTSKLILLRAMELLPKRFRILLHLNLNELPSHQGSLLR